MKGRDELSAIWARLSRRERIGVGTAGMALALLLGYFVILDPLLAGLHKASRRIGREQALYAWIARHGASLVRPTGPAPPALEPSFRAGIRDRMVQLFGRGHHFKIHVTAPHRLTLAMTSVSYERLLSGFFPFLVRHGIRVRRILIRHRTRGSSRIDVTVELEDHAQAR